MLALREEDLVKALEKRSPGKFETIHLYKQIFRVGKTRPRTGGESIWGHSASDGEKSPTLFANDIKVLGLLTLEEPSRHFVSCPAHGQQALQESHSHSRLPGNGILQAFPGVRSRPFFVPGQPVFSSSGL